MSLLSALSDPQFREDISRGLLDAGNRGVAGLLGGPVDLTAMAMRPLGYAEEKPIGGSEWIGQKMQNAGWASPQRNSLAEALAAFAGPMGVQQAAPKLNALAQVLMQNHGMGPRSGSLRAQRGAIGLDLDGQIREILENIRDIPRGERVGLRLLPDDVPTPSVGGRLPPSTRWVDGNKTPKPLYGTSSMDISSRDADGVRNAVNKLGLFNSPAQGYYPGNKLAIISGASKRRGEDAGEALIQDALVRYITDPPLGPR